MVCDWLLRPLIPSVATEKLEGTTREPGIGEMVLIAGASEQCEPNTRPAFERGASKWNNGLGNGDEGADGNSYDNNNAGISSKTGAAVGAVAAGVKLRGSH